MGYINLSWPNKELFCLCSDNMSTTDQQLLGQLLASRYVITFLVSLFGNSVIIHIVRKDHTELFDCKPSMCRYPGNNDGVIE